MRENTLKQRLYAGQAAFGVMCTFPAPPVVEMLGHLGFDWVLLDNEHGSITVDTAEACIAAAELSGMAPVVRPVANKPEVIAPFLDRGAWGVQIPHVNTAEEARAAVDAVKYGPEGHRGIFSGGRPANYGFAGTTGDYAKEANRQTLVCLMLEEVEAIENLPELVTVPGVDVYFIGSGDLSQSMGHTGQQAHPDVQAMMERGVKVITSRRAHRRVQLPRQSDPQVPGPRRAVFPQHGEPTAPARQQRLPAERAPGRRQRGKVKRSV